MAKKALPKRIFVIREIDQNDKDSTWLTAHETPNLIDHGETVGIYELKETRQMRVTRDLK